MRRELSLVAALSTAVVLPGLTAMGFVAPKNVPAPNQVRTAPVKLGHRVLRPSLTEATPPNVRAAFSRSATTKVDGHSGAVRTISGGTLTVQPPMQPSSSKQAFIDQALAVAKAKQGVLGVEPDQLKLDSDAVYMDKDVQFIKFRVVRDGLTVQDASLDFRFKQGKLLQIHNLTFTEAKSDRRPAKAGLADVARDAVSATRVEENRELYRVAKTSDGYRLVRVVEFQAWAGDKEFIVQVEAATGHIFEARSTTYHLTGEAEGHLYERYYEDGLELFAYPDLTLRYDGGTVRTDENGEFTGAPDSAEPRLDGFAGPYVKVEAETGSEPTVEGTEVRNQWQVRFEDDGGAEPHADKTVAQSHIFYHTNLIIEHAKGYIEDEWLGEQLQANANLSSTCNAHWDGSTINFYSAGGGCANTGLIADVVYHEWGHGLDANSGGIEDGAYSEGFGDIMSLLITRSNILGIGFKTDGGHVRDLEPNKVYPDDQGGGVHSEGLIIGGTFYDLFKYLRNKHGGDRAADLLAEYAYKSVFTASRYTEVYDAVLVIDDDNGDLGDKTPNYCAINKAFAEHGLADADESCELASVGEIDVDDSGLGNGNGVIEPGEEVDLWATAHNGTSEDVTNLQGELQVDASGIHVVESELAWENVPARGARRSETAATVAVDAGVACGTSFDARIQLSAGNRNASLVKTLTVGRLDGYAETVSAANLPAPIRDNETTTARVAVDSAQWDADTTVHQAHLSFEITHTYVGDLTVKLVAPGGTAKKVFEGSGSGNDVSFSEDVTDLVAGAEGRGEWKLEVSDDANRDEGTLESVELELTPARFICE